MERGRKICIYFTYNHLLNNPDIGKQMGNIGKQLISDKYNWDSISSQYIQLYKDIIDKHYES